MKRFKKLISMMLVMVMMIGMVPTTVFATEQNQSAVDTEDMGFEGGNGIGSLITSEMKQKEERESDNRYTEGYSVVDVIVEGNVATVEYNAIKNVVLVVALYSEDGIKMLNSAKTSINAGTNKVKVEFAGEMPKWFIVRAFLVDSYTFEPLCQSLENIMYTQEMKNLLASTIHDYKQELVWNMDNDETNNFAVFEENVIRISSTPGVNLIESIDGENLVYVIENADNRFISLKTGDIIAYEYTSNSMLIAKVEKLEISGTTVTITGGELKAEEVFSHLKMDLQGSTQDAMLKDDQTGTLACVEKIGKAPRSKDVAQDYLEYSKMIPFNLSSQDFNVNLDDDHSVSASTRAAVAIGIDITLQYYISSSHVFLKFITDVVINVDMTFGGSISKEIGLTDKDIKIPLGTGIVAVCFEPKIIIEISGEITLSTQTTGRVGFSVSGNRINNLSVEPETKPVGDNHYKATFKIGFDLAPGIMIGSSPITFTVEDVFILKGEASFAIYLIFDVDSYERVTAPEEDIYHACEECTSIIVSASIELGAEVAVFTESISIPIDIATLGPWQIAELYLSADMDKMGIGKCPNLAYRQTFKVVDANRESLSNVTISTLSGEIWGETNADGILVKYMDGVTAYEIILNHGEEDVEKLINPSKEPGVYFLEFNPNATNASNIVNANEDSSAYEDQSLIAQGEDGNIKWELYSSGLLRLTGNGEMKDYSMFMEYRPWGGYINAIKAVEIGQGVTRIGTAAFYNCSNLERVKIPDGMVSVGVQAFYFCTSLEEITLPGTVTEIGDEAFSNCTNMKKVTLSKGITVIAGGLFSGCQKLEKIEIPEGVTQIGSGAFTDCSGLMSVKLPEGLTKISSFAFSGCNKLLNLVLPDSMKIIEYSAFFECSNLGYVDLGNGIETIDASAFQACKAIPDIIIPATVKVMGDGCFLGCENLATVTFLGDCPKIGWWALSGLNAIVCYPAGNDTWTATVNDEHWKYTKVEWVANAVSQGTSSYGLSAPIIDIKTECTEKYILKNATFTSLVANQQYILLVLEDVTEEDTLQRENLLYIAQVTADETGAITYRYAQYKEAEKSYVILCGATGKNINDAKIAFPEMKASKEPKPVNPTVVWNGETLMEGVHYTISGRGDYTKGGTFICTIKGINDFSGSVDVEYGVEGEKEAGSTTVQDNEVIIIVVIIVVTIAAGGAVVYLKKRKRGNENEEH